VTIRKEQVTAFLQGEGFAVADAQAQAITERLNDERKGTPDDFSELNAVLDHLASFGERDAMKIDCPICTAARKYGLDNLKVRAFLRRRPRYRPTRG
jgi:hypothetical protein